VVTIFAAALLGAIECPVNTALRGAALRHVFDHSQGLVLLVEEEHLERAEPELRGSEAIPLVVVIDGRARTIGARTVLPVDELPLGPDPPPVAPNPADPATLMYTSGTTGPAKGVLLPQHFVFTTAAVKIGLWGLGPADVLFSALPLFHSNARYSTLLTACVLNARAVVVHAFSASRFWEQVREAGATEVGTVGTVAPVLLQRPPAPGDRDHRVRMMHGAGALPAEQRLVFESRFGVRLVTGFAMTETSHFSTTSPDDPGRHRAAGRPVPSFEVAVLDDADQAMEAGAIGEIAVRPRIPYSMLLGYYRDPEATAATFRNLWFHTGDVGRLDADGYLHWVDRRKDAIRRKGEMISSQDVEAAALGHASVAEAAAVGVPAELGEEEVKLVVRLRSGASLDPAELLGHCRRSLPDFAVPRYYEIVDELPRTSTHKVEKHRLRQAGIGARTWDARQR
jgi:crotonobetaine/carnitine-CoA ligase